MAVRLIITFTAPAGKGSALAEEFRTRSVAVVTEPGCEQFEIFQSAADPDRLTLLELWSDQAALDVHAKLNTTRPPLPEDLRPTAVTREDYEYSRTH